MNKQFTQTDEVGDTLQGIYAGTSVATHTTGQQGTGPLVVLNAEQRVEFAAFLLQGTGFEVTEKESTKQLLQEMASEAGLTPSQPKSAQDYAQSLAKALTGKFSVNYEGKWHGSTHKVEVEKGGRKYVRLSISNTTYKPEGDSKSVYCFVDAQGNVYKPAGWKAPAQGVRANVSKAEDLIDFVNSADPFGGSLYAK